MNTASDAGARLASLMGSQGFRTALNEWMVHDKIRLDDLRDFRLGRDPHTGDSMIVVELNDGRQRGFPFAMHTTH